MIESSHPIRRGLNTWSRWKLFGVLAVSAMIIAPLLDQMESIFAYLQKINGLFSVPIISIFLVGLLTKTFLNFAKIALVVDLVSYGYYIFSHRRTSLASRILHLLLAAVGTMLIGGVVRPKSRMRSPRVMNDHPRPLI